MTAEEKFLIDVALVALIVLIWVRWRRNGPGSHNGEACLGLDFSDPVCAPSRS
jgi:hypothetical protein